MSRVKEILVKVIPSKIANEFVKKYHYSGKVVANSLLHFGAFLDGKLHGVMSYGNPLDRSRVLSLVHNNKNESVSWNDMLELNRMAFDDMLPKNSESRCISISIKLIKKNASHIKWLLSYSDGTQCGDGTIYRATGFQLTGIKKNTQLFELKDGRKFHKMNFATARPTPVQKKLRHETGMLTGSVGLLIKKLDAKVLKGFQLRYIYLIDKSCKITVPVLPFSKIDEFNAGMYKGEKISLRERKEKSVISIDSDATPFQEDKAGQFRP